MNVDDINGLIQTAIGGDVATQVVQGEKQFDLVVRLERQYRDNPEEIGNIPVATPGGQQIPLKEFADIQVTNGASFIYREDNSRYIGVQFSVEGRDLAGAVGDAIQQVNAKVALPQGYRLDWGGEYTEYTASRAQTECHSAADLVPDFPSAVRALQQFQIPVHHRARRGAVGAGGRHRGAMDHRHAVFGFVRHRLPGLVRRLGADGRRLYLLCQRTSPQRHRPRRGHSQGAILRLRPIMMTALVAALGLLPAALATGVGTDTQRPFALVIVSGLFTRLLISIFLMPVLYALVARPGDRLEV